MDGNPNSLATVVEATSSKTGFYRSWMKQNEQAFADKRLRELCLPATHDSGTYDLANRLLKGADYDDWLVGVLNAIGKVADGIPKIPVMDDLVDAKSWLIGKALPSIRGFSTATGRTIAEQLNDGIRGFDFRVCYEDGDYFIWHGLRGPRLSDILDQLQEFLSSTKGEVVYLTFGHFSGIPDDWLNKDPKTYLRRPLAELISNVLGKHAYLRVGGGSGENNPFEQKYKDIIRQNDKEGSRAIIVAPNEVYPGGNILPNETTCPFLDAKYEDGSVSGFVFWPMYPYSVPDYTEDTYFQSGFANSDDLDTVVEANKKAYDIAQKQNKPCSISLTLTPQKAVVVTIVLSNLYRPMLTMAAATLWIAFPVSAALTAAAGALFTAGIITGIVKYRSLWELSRRASDRLASRLAEIQPLDTKANRISLLYTDFYEDTNVVDIAIRYSGGVVPSHPRMRQTFGLSTPGAGRGLVAGGWVGCVMLGIGQDGALWKRTAENDWGGWGRNDQLTPLTLTGDKHDNGIELFATDSSGKVWNSNYYRREGDDGGSWTDWGERIDGRGYKASSLLALNNTRGGSLELFAIDENKSLWHAWKTKDASWNAWYRFPTLTHKTTPPSGGEPQQPALLAESVFGTMYDAGDQPVLALFAIGQNGELWHTWYADRWFEWFPNFNAPPATFDSGMAIYNRHSRSLELFAIGTDQVLYHCYFNDGQWYPWEARFKGATFRADEIVGVTNTVNENPEVFVLDAEGWLWHSAYDTNWSDWSSRFRGQNRPFASVQAFNDDDNPQGGTYVVGSASGSVSQIVFGRDTRSWGDWTE